MSDDDERITCARLLPYSVHEMRSNGMAGDGRCGRPAVDMGGPEEFDQQARCAVHRGVDKRTATNRETIRRRHYLLLRAKRGQQ